MVSAVEMALGAPLPGCATFIALGCSPSPTWKLRSPETVTHSWCFARLVQDYFSSSDARQRQTAQIQAEMDRTKDVMHETIGESCNSFSSHAASGRSQLASLLRGCR
jgi:hypothetical protein